LNYTYENTGWVVLVTDGSIYQIFHALDGRPTGRSIYALSARSTRLTFAEFISPFLFPFRTTQILSGEVALQLETDLPVPDDVYGGTLTLDGVHAQLQVGQKIIVQGDAGAEPAVIAQPVETDSDDNVTFVQLKDPLVNSYTLSTCTVLANVVLATQGETVKDEILGSGNALPFQSFALAQKPLTYLPSTDAEGLSAVQSSLIVTVNGVAWTEQPTLASSGPEAQEFITAQDDSSQTTVSFGDGFNGARPPSGANNIHARYRKGLGSSGNLAGGLIQQLVDSTPNLQKVTNPIASTGGGDPETPAQIRTNAPSSMRTFGRAVNVADHAALALSYPGIGKASASWIVTDPVTGQTLAHPYIQLTAATLDGTPLQGTILATRLRGYLDNHRDPNVPLRLRDFDPVYLNVAVNVQIEDRFPHQATLDQVQAALTGLFSFENLQFGQTIYLIQLYAAIQTIPGVLDSNITALQRLGPAFPDPPSAAPHDIVTGPTEIATIDPVAFPGSALTVTGQGGYADQ
jgi:predicted phage baseplate assembly protein